MQSFIHFLPGELTLANSLIREPMKNQYFLAVAAFDNGFPQLSSETTVKIIVPENHPPIIPASMSFEVFENIPKGVIVGKVEARDEDVFENSTQHLTYRIIEEGQDFLSPPHCLSIYSFSQRSPNSFDIILMPKFPAFFDKIF